jgi:hypothetical protein
LRAVVPPRYRLSTVTRVTTPPMWYRFGTARDPVTPRGHCGTSSGTAGGTTAVSPRGQIYGEFRIQSGTTALLGGPYKRPLLPQLVFSSSLTLSSIVAELKPCGSAHLANQSCPNLEEWWRRPRSTNLPREFSPIRASPLWILLLGFLWWDLGGSAPMESSLVLC